MFGNRHGNACNIHLLECILSQQGQNHIGCNRHHGNTVHIGGGNARYKVDGAGAGGRHHNARAACSHTDSHVSGGPRITVRRMGRPLLMGRQYMLNLFMFI